MTDALFLPGRLVRYVEREPMGAIRAGERAKSSVLKANHGSVYSTA
jgi:hypothetical protein